MKKVSEYIKEQLKNPEVKKEYDALEEEYKKINQELKGEPQMKTKFVQCPYCKDIIHSTYSGHFVWCSCQKTFIDQTEYYIRTTSDSIVIENDVEE